MGRLMLECLLLLAIGLLAVSGHVEGWASGHATWKGRRNYLQDRVLVASNINLGDKDYGRVGLFGVFGGAPGGGNETVQLLSDEFENIFVLQLQKDLRRDAHLDAETVKVSLNKTMFDLDDLAVSRKLHDHASACVVVITEKDIVSAKLGDYCALMACVPDPVSLTEDAERGTDYFPLIGHWHAKRFVKMTPPSISSWTRTKQDGFIVVASDGLYDGTREREVCDIAWKESNGKGGTLAQTIADQAVERSKVTSRDSVAVVVIPLNQ